MKQSSLTRLYHDAQARAILEPYQTARIAAVAAPQRVCCICCHERGITIPGASHGVCAAHRSDSMRDVLATALDEMTMEVAG